VGTGAVELDFDARGLRSLAYRGGGARRLFRSRGVWTFGQGAKTGYCSCGEDLSAGEQQLPCNPTPERGFMRLSRFLAVVGILAIAPGHPHAADRKPPSNEQINAIELLTFSGQRATLKDYRSRVTVINVWTDSCPPCLKELPLLQKLADAYRGDGDVSVVALSFDPTGEHPATPTAKAISVVRKLALRLPVLWDPRFQFMALAKSDAQSFPVTFIIDDQGRVSQETGFAPTAEAEFLATKRKQIDSAKAR
jgi:thiol-disulfide isomerase/thioredoxin